MSRKKRRQLLCFDFIILGSESPKIADFDFREFASLVFARLLAKTFLLLRSRYLPVVDPRLILMSALSGLRDQLAMTAAGRFIGERTRCGHTRS